MVSNQGTAMPALCSRLKDPEFWKWLSAVLEAARQAVWLLVAAATAWNLF